MSKGRNRKGGDRYPSGKLKHPKQDEIAPALLGRLRDLSPGTVTIIGRLNLIGRITNKQAATAVRIGEVYQKWFRLKGIKTTPKSPSFEVGFGGTDSDLAEERMSDAQVEAYEVQILVAEKEWKLVDGILQAFPRDVRNAVVDLCVHDQSIPLMLYDHVRAALDVVSARWGDWRPAKKSKSFLMAASAPIEQLQAEVPKYEDPNWNATLAILKEKMPDIDATELADTKTRWIAFRDRDRIRLKRTAR